MGIVNEFRYYGEDLKDQKNVENILRSLPTKFDGVVFAIEESKDLTQLSVNELMGSLQSHEQRINRYSEKSIGKAFQERGNIFKDKSGSSHEKSKNTFGRGRGIGQTYRGGRGRGRFFLAYNKGRGNKDGFVEIDESKKYNVLLGDDRSVEAKEPRCFEDTVKELVWCKEMDEEMETIKKNATWELVDPPTEKEVFGVKWLYKTKYAADGTIQRHKARLVAKGYAQQLGIDYNETYAHVTRFDTIKHNING
eukprot:PITA_13542